MANSATEYRTRLTRHRAGALAAAALALLAFACAGNKKIKGPLLLHPAPTTAESYALTMGALVFAGPDFSVAVRPWDYRLVAGEMENPKQPSPFGDTEEEVGRFVFFKVRLENKSTHTLVFNPMNAALVQKGDTPELALENSDLFAFADDKFAEAEARSRTFRRLCFDGTTSVRPGQSIERYLVFRAPKESEKLLLLKLPEFLLGSKSYDAKFTFEVYPGK